MLSTWNGGSLDGVQVYNNTTYWNPTRNIAAYRGAGHNLRRRPATLLQEQHCLPSAGSFVDLPSGIALDNNLYWHTGAPG